MGWVGSILLSLCAFPQVVKTIRQGHCAELSLPFLTLWFLGELLLTFHSISIADAALFLNYVLNSALVLILLKYRLLPCTPAYITSSEPPSD